MKRILFYFAIAMTAWLVACSPTPVPPTTSSGPEPPDGGTATCADVCAHEAALDCPAGKPTSAGASCEEVCSNVLATGLLHWDLACRASAPSCAAIDRCP